MTDDFPLLRNSELLIIVPRLVNGPLPHSLGVGFNFNICRSDAIAARPEISSAPSEASRSDRRPHTKQRRMLKATEWRPQTATWLGAPRTTNLQEQVRTLRRAQAERYVRRPLLLDDLAPRLRSEICIIDVKRHSSVVAIACEYRCCASVFRPPDIENH